MDFPWQDLLRSSSVQRGHFLNLFDDPPGIDARMLSGLHRRITSIEYFRPRY
jgi:hypothetical protein